jgi:hypothetical protein
MPLPPFGARTRSVLGWLVLTPVELILLAGIVVMILWGGLPRYQAWRHTGLMEEEQRVVAAVRGRLAVMTDLGRPRPAALDSCADGPASVESPFFRAVLSRPVTGGHWHKAKGAYVGPAGSIYRYDPVTTRLIRTVPKITSPGKPWSAHP